MSGVGKSCSRLILGCLATSVFASCVGGARVELADADVLDELRSSLATAMNEMHADILLGDTWRERSITDALVKRLVTEDENVDADSANGHKQDFLQALARIREDRQTQWARLLATRDNLLLIGEVSDGLRRLAIDTMSLEDEARRYLMSVIESVRGNLGATAATITQRIAARPGQPIGEPTHESN